MNKGQTYIEGIQKNDRTVIQEIYRAYFSKIKAYVLANNGSETDAHDVFQEALVAIFRKSQTGELKLTSAFYTFLYAISRNLWLNELKKKKLDRVTKSALNVSSIDNTAEEVIIQHDRYQLYRQKFALLSGGCRELLTLFLEGTSMREIAEKLDISEKYARKRKFDCKQKLVNLVQIAPEFKELSSYD